MYSRIEYISSRKYGQSPEERDISTLLNEGVVIIDKPRGPTSHQVAAWVKDILEVPLAGHGGTLDPKVTGVLPVALNKATKCIESLRYGQKEYYGIMHLHQSVSMNELTEILENFKGKIYQLPPVRASVKRDLRTREIYEFEIVEIDKLDILFRVKCEAGTYIRTLCHDIGEALCVGAHMIELRRTSVGCMSESQSVTLQTLVDAYTIWKENNDERLLRKVIQPKEILVEHLKKVIIKDSAVDAICHGAPLMFSGIVKFNGDLQKDEPIAILTGKGELVALGKTCATNNEIRNETKGIACIPTRVIMKRGVYPRQWKEKGQ